jgi:hypothetical protein
MKAGLIDVGWLTNFAEQGIHQPIINTLSEMGVETSLQTGQGVLNPDLEKF